MNRGNRDNGPASGLLQRLRERGVVRVAASYAVIAWLALQIASVVLDPLGVPKWVMTALIIAAAAGFPIAIGLAWFLEIGPAGVTVDRAPDGTARPTARGLRHFADVIVIGVLLLAVVALLVRQSGTGRPAPPPNPAIAVLPFENLSGDPEQQYFSDGLAEDMLDRLGRVPGLRVIARSSSFGFRGKDVDARTVAEKLGVTAVLEGSVRREGRKLKLNARLIDGSTGQLSWSGSFDREVTDVFDVQSELAAAIVAAIVPAARGATAAPVNPPTSDLSAYDLYLLARSQMAVRVGPALKKSVELMDQATRIDPKFALAHAHRAQSLLLLRGYGEGSASEQAEWLSEAERSAHTALAIDPNLSEAHQAYATLLRESGRPGAEEEYKRALEINPNNAAAWHDYSILLDRNGHPRAEVARMEARALDLDPRQPVYWSNYLPTTLEPGGKRYRASVDRAIQAVGDMPDALNFIGIGTVQYGYPIETMKVAQAKLRLRSDEVARAWVFLSRAWLPVDLDRAWAALPDPREVAGNVFLSRILYFARAEIAGRRGDWTNLDDELAALLSSPDDWTQAANSTNAFWLALEGRHAQAAEALSRAEPLLDFTPPVRLGGDLDFGVMDPARLRILRGTGHSADADRLASELLSRLRKERGAAGDSCQWSGWMRYAAVAANEGRRDEAVDALKGAMRCYELPFAFQPQLPWFRGLDGMAAYEAIKTEREARVARIREELTRMEVDGARNAAPR